jgi:hypothetical protein
MTEPTPDLEPVEDYLDTVAELEHGKPTTYTKRGCRCTECRAAASAYSRTRKWKRAETRGEDRVAPWVQEHGRNAYQNSMCRCNVCTNAHKLYERKIRDTRRAQRVLVDGRPTAMHVKEHGLAATYTNWSCRCQPCTRANTEYERSRRPLKGPPAWVAALEVARAIPGQWHLITTRATRDAASAFAYKCRTGMTKTIDSPDKWEFRATGLEVYARYAP